MGGIILYSKSPIYSSIEFIPKRKDNFYAWRYRRVGPPHYKRKPTIAPHQAFLVNRKS